MPKKIRRDENEVAFDLVQAMIGEAPRPLPPGEREKNSEAVKRGRRGGKKGGKARAAKLSASKRARIARGAAVARWKNKPDK